MLNADPLKIVYLLVMDDITFESMSPFQGFGASWLDLHWAMHLIVHLPGDVAERSHSLEAIAPQRVAGLRPFLWQPINVSALEQFRLEEAEPFVGPKEQEYTDLILETAGAVRHIRQEVMDG